MKTHWTPMAKLWVCFAFGLTIFGGIMIALLPPPPAPGSGEWWAEGLRKKDIDRRLLEACNWELNDPRGRPPACMLDKRFDYRDPSAAARREQLKRR
jgi:hypothetical protein